MQAYVMAVVSIETLAFLLFALLTVGASVGVVLVRDVWHSALLLGVALLSVAVHYVMLRAEFLAVMQVLVYVGGVLILITFAVMLVRRDPVSDADADPDADTGVTR
jgi:NADH-quinone oxidoreductase subunit J